MHAPFHVIVSLVYDSWATTDISNRHCPAPPKAPLLALPGHPHPGRSPREFWERMGIGERGTLTWVLRPGGCGIRLGLCREKRSAPVCSGKHIPAFGFKLVALSHPEWGAGRGILSLE